MVLLAGALLLAGCAGPSGGSGSSGIGGGAPIDPGPRVAADAGPVEPARDERAVGGGAAVDEPARPAEGGDPERGTRPPERAGGSSGTADGGRRDAPVVSPVGDGPPPQRTGGEPSRRETADREAARRSPARCRRDAEDLIRRLGGDFLDSQDAYREIERVRADVIPHLIPWVDDRRPTKFFQLDIVALQKNSEVVRIDEKDGRLYYYVKGMGRFVFDDIAAGKARGRSGGLRIRYRNFRSSFPLGVVLRAALLNRFRDADLPRLDDTDIVRWWEAYWERCRHRL